MQGGGETHRARAEFVHKPSEAPREKVIPGKVRHVVKSSFLADFFPPPGRGGSEWHGCGGEGSINYS